MMILLPLAQTRLGTPSARGNGNGNGHGDDDEDYDAVTSETGDSTLQTLEDDEASGSATAQQLSAGGAGTS